MDKNAENPSKKELLNTLQEISFSSEPKKPNTSSILLPVFSLIESDFQEEEKESRIWSYSRLPSSGIEILSHDEHHLRSKTKLSNEPAKNKDSNTSVDFVEGRVPNIDLTINQRKTAADISREEENEGNIHLNK